LSSTRQLALSPAQQRLVRDSFQSIREYELSVVLLFYGRLFEIAPEVRTLFKINIRDQARKLMDTLALVVDAVDRFEALRPRLEELGRRHIGYGAQPQHYEVLCSALVWAIAQALGAECDRETKEAWKELLSAISSVMLEGAAQNVPSGD
jgi:nitric oxide dioxygenase